MLHLPIRKELFWDVDLTRFDEDTHARLVIERVFCYGTVRELKIIFFYYGKEKIKKNIIDAGYLDKKTLSFASSYLKIPKEKFRCYKKKQSKQVHWT